MNSSPPSEMVSQPLEQHPLYKATGNDKRDLLAFFHVLERLKTQKRTGWVDHKIPDPESISDHMYRMAIMAMCCSDTTLDITKCVLLALVHDIAEAQVGDITPRHGFSKEEKVKMEEGTMQNFVHEMLHDSPAARRIMDLWKEYEARETPEALFVKDLDRFEMAAQAFAYERRTGLDLETFYDSSIPSIRHPEVRSWATELEVERKEAREGRTSVTADNSGSSAP
ncbi:HD domain-containing protein [Schizophyllum commune H4-8]|uniref:HD domain-containing protein n=1 Tax=Schizophyllum commune (strain H4-8 / FGSC 9210) TaxID=578458 RepID=UPI002160967B|nr:HD domain-containing protein [Schizophyllum commune H4-8]KAI5895165.1 HD domain-containing protein [Schizophyllum commune H4-8]